MAAAEGLQGLLSRETVAFLPDFFEAFWGIKVHVMVRFGMWDELRAEPKPDIGSRFMTGIWHYARGLAYTRKNETAKGALQFADLAEITVDESMTELEFPLAVS